MDGFEPLRLINLQTTVLLPPVVRALIGDSDLRDRLTLRKKRVRFPTMLNDLKTIVLT